MRIAVLAETDKSEPRVAATPETVKKFIGLGAEVAVQAGAGMASGVSDADYAAAGAKIGARQRGPRPLVEKIAHFSALGPYTRDALSS